MAEKKGFFERLGIAWASRSSESDVQMLIAAPEGQLGYNLGLKLHEFLSNLPDELRMEALNAYPTTSEAQIGFALGEGLANSISDFKRGVTSVDTRTPDEIDSEREEETPVSAAEESIIAYTNNIVQQVAETSRRRVQGEIKPKTIEDLRAEAFGEYQSTGNTDKLLENLASIDSAEDLSREINNAEYAYEQAFFFGNEVGYYGIDSANAVEDLRASSGNENLVPLYNIGLEETFLENLPPDRVADYQLALFKAGFLPAGSFISGEYDQATKDAVKASFSYMNPKAQFGIDSNDLQEIALASGGNNAAFLGFIRDFYLDGLDDIDFTDVDNINTGPSIIAMPSPENLKQQIDTAVTGIAGVTPNDTLYYGVQEWASGKIRELTQSYEQGQRKFRNQKRMAQEDALRRKKFGLPEKTYEIDAPMTTDNISEAFNYELQNYVRSQFKDLIDTGQEENAYKKGLASVIAAFSK
jgi:hypothetical protein